MFCGGLEPLSEGSDVSERQLKRFHPAGDRRRAARDTSLVVAYVCKVGRPERVSVLPAGGEELRVSPSSSLLSTAPSQERKLSGSSGQGAGFARVSGSSEPADFS